MEGKVPAHAFHPDKLGQRKANKGWRVQRKGTARKTSTLKKPLYFEFLNEC